jgi:single-stranded-DNA-specific exonuclease
MAKTWTLVEPLEDAVAAAQRWGVTPIVARLLLNRGLSGNQSPTEFLSPQLKDIPGPAALSGVSSAADRIAEAVDLGQRIVLYGDYDVDGIAGVAILWHVLRQAGADLIFYVPHRIEEGYGLNADAARRLIDEERANLIVSVDCGITAVEAAQAIKVAGADLIVTDHHSPHGSLPEACAIVHPHLGDYPNPYLSGSGVAFKLAWAVAQKMSGTERVSPEYRELLKEMLPLAALGTIADVVPLTGENRTLARCGLEGLTTTSLPGLRALIETAGLTSARITGSDVGFKLAPRINAAGRMGHARLAVELLTRADNDRAREIALYLDDHNRTRQAVERQIARQAYEMVEQKNLASDARRAIVLASDGWHPGVIGIVAARVVDRFHRPAALIALNNGVGQGSARSIRGFHLAEALAACEEHLLSFGGHAMAAGLRIAGDRVESFSAAFVETANNRLTGADLVPALRLDGEAALAELTLTTTETILGLGPFGHGNPRPRLCTGWLELHEEPRQVGKNEEHLQVVFRENGTCIRGIGFGLGSVIEELKQHRRCRVAFEPIINEFQGRRSVEMQILDVKFPG